MLINASPRLLYEGVAGWRIQSWVKGFQAARNLLLGEAPGAVVGPDRRAGERGENAVLRCVGGRCFGKKSSGVGRDMAALGDFGGKIIGASIAFRAALPRFI